MQASSLHTIQATMQEFYFATHDTNTSISSCSGENDSGIMSEQDDKELSWRLDPADSMSDWTIVVVDEESTLEQSYHVHRSALHFGPRRSTYFSLDFAKQSLQAARPNSSVLATDDEGACHWFDSSPFMSVRGHKASQGDEEKAIQHPPVVSKLRLNHLAAESFPDVLDYIYSSSGALNISTANATALHFLSQLLEIKSLQRKVHLFWTSDLSLENICTYLQHAKHFKDQKILDFAEHYYANHIFEMRGDRAVEILTCFDPSSFLRVVTSPAVGCGTTTSLGLSLIISVYCTIHKQLMGRTLFRRMTSSGHLPVLEPRSAKALLEIEYDIGGASSVNDPSSLKSRCIPVLAENWFELCQTRKGDTKATEGGDDMMGVSIPQLHGNQLGQFTSLALQNAKERLQRVETKYDALVRRNKILQHALEASSQSALRSVTSPDMTGVSDVAVGPDVVATDPPPIRL